MNGLWWLALPALLLPIWWHRKKSEQRKAESLATARFLPRTDPRQVRVWRFSDPLLLLVRCLLLASLIAWLADPVFPWRGDTIIVAEGSDPAWVEREAARLGGAERMSMPAEQALAWLAAHEREWKKDARVLVLGDIPMPATRPAFGRNVELRTLAKPARTLEHQVHIESERPQEWRRLFAAIDPPGSLVVWDRPGTPPASLRAPLWWVVDPAAFPELRNALDIDGIRMADTPRGRVWQLSGPPRDVQAARTLVENWQELHLGPRRYTTPSQVFTASPDVRAPLPSGALRDLLLAVVAALFVLERVLTHARKR